MGVQGFWFGARASTDSAEGRDSGACFDQGVSLLSPVPLALVGGTTTTFCVTDDLNPRPETPTALDYQL